MIESKFLHQTLGYIGGKWVRAGSREVLEVRNPATGEILAAVPNMREEETSAAIEAAEKSLGSPATLEQRKNWLQEITRRLLENREELGRIITLEQGKPLKEAIVEAEYAAGFFRYCAEHLDFLQPQTLNSKIRNARWTIHHRPAGVVGLITPWNFPLAMLAKKLPPAIAADCGMVIKPAGLTPLSAIALVRIAEESGVAPGKINLVTGRAGPIGKVLCENPKVRVISFTGSTETGQLLLKETAPYVKRLALELGGNAPFIVFDDADVNLAVESLVANKFRCAGQTCVCANRVYAQIGIISKFTEALAARLSKLKMGHGMESGVEIGPLMDKAAFDKVSNHVHDALGHWAKRIVGTDPEPPKENWGCFYPPTLLVDAHEEMLVFKEETFGPVIAVAEFASEEEVIRRANGTPYGLAAYLFTQNPERAQRCAGQLIFGHLAVNTGSGPTPEAPFGGMKMSGFGREGGLEGFSEFTEIQTVASLES